MCQVNNDIRDKKFQILRTHLKEKIYERSSVKFEYLLGIKNIFKPLIFNMKL